MSVYARCVAKNELAIVALRQEQNNQAVAHLGEAMRDLIQTINAPDKQTLHVPMPRNLSDKCRDDCHYLRYSRSESLIIAGLPEMPSTDLSVSPDNVFTVYNRAFDFGPGFGCDYNFKQNEGVASACMLYNMGLVHHRFGVTYGRLSKLQKALKFYEMALTSIHQGVCSGIFSVDMLVLAICNNLGHIRSVFFDRAGAQRCRTYIVEALPAIEQQYYNAGLKRDCCDEDGLAFFYLMTLYGEQYSSIVFAPAA